MTRSTRRRIFYILVVLFIIVGTTVVFYADGWRLDLENWHVTKIGGIYVRSYPEGALIYLDGKPVQNQTGFLSPGTLISDLLPRTYSVALKSAGYDDWQENASVSPSQVVQFKYAVLVPQDGTPVPSSSVKQLAPLLATEVATTTDPYDQNQKIVIGKNKISIFDIAQATTTQSVNITGKNIAVKWISGNIIGILQDDGECYLYDTNAGTITKLADDVKDFSATSDGSMIATLENDSLEIFSLSDASAYARFNIPDVANAQHIIWYHDKSHLFVVYANHVSFLDLADTGLINFTTVAQGTNPFYDLHTNMLYLNAADASATLMQYSFQD
jgi:hypothetical protein